MAHDSKCGLILNKTLKYCYSQCFFCFFFKDTSIFASTWAAVDVSVRFTIWEADPAGKPTPSSTPTAAAAKETLRCQNKVWPAHFNRASRSRWIWKPVEGNVHTSTLIRKDRDSRKQTASTDHHECFLSPSLCDEKVLVCLRRHDDKMINRRALARVRGHGSASSRPRIRPQLSQLRVWCLPSNAGGFFSPKTLRLLRKEQGLFLLQGPRAERKWSRSPSALQLHHHHHHHHGVEKTVQDSSCVQVVWEW